MIEQLHIWLVQSGDGESEAVVAAASVPQAKQLAEAEIGDAYYTVATQLASCPIETHLTPMLILAGTSRADRD
jgi:hypothetical protein